jgi:hypothetical protein
MTVEEAIAFLMGHQPLPKLDAPGAEQLAENYDAAVAVLSQTPHPLASSLILGALGEGDEPDLCHYAIRRFYFLLRKSVVIMKPETAPRPAPVKPSHWRRKALNSGGLGATPPIEHPGAARSTR